MPRWVKFEIRLFIVAALSFAVIMLGAFLELTWVTPLGRRLFVLVIFLMLSLVVAPILLSFIGYWFPSVALKAAQLNCWLERDLDWEK
jgi:hypothetical protein